MNRDKIKLIKFNLTKSIAQLWRRRNPRKDNTVLEGDVSLDRDDIIEWGQGQEKSCFFKEKYGIIILHVLDYYSCLLRLLLPLTA